MSVIRYWLAGVVLGLGCWSASASEPNERYLIGFSQGAEQSVRSAVAASGGQIKRALPKRRLLSALLPPGGTRALRARADVTLLEIDPKRFTQAQVTPYGIPMVQAYNPAGGTGLPEVPSNRKVCVMDTGYDLTHPDLPSAGITGNDDCGAGCGSSGNWFEDGHGHGTHVSGTIAALDNSEGVVGVNANGWLDMHVVKVFDDQGNWAYGSDIIAAIDQCAQAGAHIVNMSLGGPGSSAAEQAAFDEAYAEGNGMLFVAAAGNGGTNALSYPASYDAVVSVGAIDANQAVAGFSQFNHQVEIAGPGVAVQSTLPGNSYDAWNGTSMATPHVSGVAALVWGYFESCTAGQIRNALVAAASDLGGPGRDSSYGHGLIQAITAHDKLLDSCLVAAPPDQGYIDTLLDQDVPTAIDVAAAGDEHQYRLEVPAGATDLRIQIYDTYPGASGGAGDMDLYVVEPAAAQAYPAANVWDCRPYINGSSETCVYDQPTSGTWRVMLRAFIDSNDVSLQAGYVTSAGPIRQYHVPDADIPVVGSVSPSFADLAFNDGALQTLTEVTSGGKPSQRTSLAEHQWRIPGVTSGSDVTLHLVVAGGDDGEQDSFGFDYSDDGGLSWNSVCLTPPALCDLRTGGALQYYQVPLPPTTAGTVLVRARDNDRTARNLANNVLYLDQMNIVTTNPLATPPPPPPPPEELTLSASGEKRKKGKIYVTLNWMPPATTVSIHRSVNGGPFATVQGAVTGGAWEDPTGLKGSPVLDYYACYVSDPTDCSQTATVEF